MKHLKVSLPLGGIDADKLTFPRLIIGECVEGLNRYPAVIPAERVTELFGTGQAHDYRSHAVFVWRERNVPSAEVYAEIEAFNADPVRGWATLIRDAALAEVEHWTRVAKEAKAYAKAAAIAAEGAAELLAGPDEDTEVHP